MRCHVLLHVLFCVVGLGYYGLLNVLLCVVAYAVMCAIYKILDEHSQAK